MQNYEVEVKNHSEVTEAQDLFFGMGYRKGVCVDSRYPKLIVTHNNNDGWYSAGAMIGHNNKYKKITLQELRDMVAPKQKEYLVKTDTGYTLQVLSDVVDGHNGIIEVPEGSNIAWKDNSNGFVFFTKMEMGYRDATVIWQRESLNDQVASAEQARQEQTQTREISECDLIDSGKLIIGGFGESFPVGLEHHKFIQPEEPPFVGDEPTGVDGTLAERQAQYGNFSEVAEMTQQLLTVMGQYGYEYLPDMHKEALHMICSKMARIVNGDHNHLDSWHDIGGYAKLIENNIK